MGGLLALSIIWCLNIIIIYINIHGIKIMYDYWLYVYNQRLIPVGINEIHYFYLSF